MSIDGTLRKAAKLAKTGDRAGAAALYRQVLAKFPGNAQARKGLQALGSAGTRPMPLAGQIPRPAAAAKDTPGPSQAQLNALATLMQRHDFASVVAEGQRLALLFPASVPLLNLLAGAQVGLGRFAEALATSERAIKADPGQAQAHGNRALTLTRMGRAEDAIKPAREAVRLAPALTEPHLTLGIALTACGRADEAIDQFQTVVRMSPGLARAHLGLGHALGLTGRLDEAMAAYREAVRIDPQNADAWNNLGNILSNLRRIDEALEAYRAGIAANPKNPQILSNNAIALRTAGRQEDALACCERAIELAPRFAEAWSCKGACLRELGRYDEADAALRRAIEIAPNHADALSNLWGSEPLPLDDPEFDRLSALVETPDLPDRSRSQIHFVLFNALDKAGEPDRAFAHLEAANRFRRLASPYSLDEDKKAFAELRKVFARPVAPLDVAPATPRPVFIVGMPRSGTTLVEQILASHSQVHGAGELPVFTIALEAQGWSGAADGLPPTPDRLAAMRRDYLAALSRLDTDRPVITDKMPLNFRWLGYILSALPEARVLHTKRDARATCWSIYRQNFSAQGNRYAYDMADVAAYYRLYVDLMDLWENRFPGRIHTVDYEKLTENQEQESRKLVAAAGLDWEPACLDFHKTDRAVRTASREQVRQKMYTGSSEAWRRYEVHLRPMLERLKGI